MLGRNSKSKIIQPDFLLLAYCNGYFPMAESKVGNIYWYSPDPRAILELDDFRRSRSLRQVLKKNVFEIRFNTTFEEVIRACAERKDTWISEEIVQSYLQLHRLGFAHSVGAWQGNRLAGGLYGVAVGAAFFGESMFHRVKDASKVALAFLVDHLREMGFQLLDIQFMTQFFESVGAKEIPKQEYLKRLYKAVQKDCQFL